MLIPAAANDLLLAIIAFAIVLIPAIIIHELGHFVAAKLVGINVLEFGIGFPPRLGKLFTWRETEFTINLLPIGGFVRPLGEDMIGPTTEDKLKRDKVELVQRRSKLVRIVSEREMLRLRGVDDEDIMSVNDAPALGRIFFMAAGAFANFATAVVLFFVAALIGLSMPVGGLSQILAIPPGSIFAGSAAQVGDAIERINGERFQDFGSFHDLLAGYQGERMDFTLLRPGTGETFELTVEPRYGGRAGMAQILAIFEESPAAEAGLLAGDIITRVNHLPIPSAGDPATTVSEAAREAQGKELPMTILREGEDGEAETFEVVLVPRLEPPEGQGLLGIGVRSLFRLGEGTRFANAGYRYEYVPQSASQAIAYSLKTTGDTLALIASIPGQLLDGSLSGEDARPISIIGISKIGGELLSRSLRDGPSIMLQFVALISIFLGFTNLLPIPALDGGRIVFVLIEMLRGRPVNPKIEARVHQVGIILLLILGVVIMAYDLINPPSLP